jgi:hypothetical protein
MNGWMYLRVRYGVVGQRLNTRISGRLSCVMITTPYIIIKYSCLLIAFVLLDGG